MAFEVRVSDSGVKLIEALDFKTAQRIKRGIEQLQKDPFSSRSGADIKMFRGIKGGESLYRLRVGDYRVIYVVSDSVVLVTKIFHRGKGYDWLN